MGEEGMMLGARRGKGREWIDGLSILVWMKGTTLEETDRKSLEEANRLLRDKWDRPGSAVDRESRMLQMADTGWSHCTMHAGALLLRRVRKTSGVRYLLRETTTRCCPWKAERQDDRIPDNFGKGTAQTGCGDQC
jgi:hypothetical protein